MGRVGTKAVKKAAQVITEKYDTGSYVRTGNRVCKEMATIPSKSSATREQAVTHQMEHIQRGPVRGLSVKLLREKRENYGPEVSAPDQESTEVDPHTKEILKPLHFASLSDLQVTWPMVGMCFKTPRGGAHGWLSRLGVRLQLRSRSQGQ
ncbi:40S ribosomal protein S17-like [Herpailurus yagouaroundi]|uniref:40S ribosomal protein S17-like n=1 Tax=Herpailurus yagouaroundi TaxID=1608482 RepID=UPI001AD7BE7A|nr:40S ribosomal protein S17-like [Puma yagouaroundi]